MRIALAKGDITKMAADAICNAANARLRGGGGVDGAIHRACGPEIMEELRRIQGCPTGQAVATGAGKLPAKWVFHAVGPVYGGRPEDAELLASAYRSCLKLAVEKCARTVTFPSISTGAYGYPVEEAASIALRTVVEFLETALSIEKVTFVLFDDRTYEAYAAALKREARWGVQSL